jgi:RHS repeat-associated protein
MTGEGAMTFQYDAANRLKSVNNGTGGSYGFDGDGQRVKKVEGSVTVFYVRSSVTGKALMEVGGNGALYRAYLYGKNTLVAQLTPDGQFYWQHNQHLGSGYKLTNASGAVVYRGEFDPYGQTLLETGSTTLNSHKFTGYEKDQSTGLDYAEARMYAGSRGRFTKPDPQWLSAASARRPQSLNRYSYVNNDPVNFVDRTGLGGCGATICDGVTIHGGGDNRVDPEGGTPGLIGAGSAGILLDGGENPNGGAGEGEPVWDWKSVAQDIANKIKSKVLTPGSPCGMFFGPNAADALDTLVAKIETQTTGGNPTPTGISLTFAPNNTPFSLDANGNKLFRIPASVTVNVNGPFTPFGKDNQLGGFSAGTPGAQMVALLHEVAHLIVVPLSNGSHRYLIPDDGPSSNNANASSANTETIMKNCEKQIFDAAK